MAGENDQDTEQGGPAKPKRGRAGRWGAAVIIVLFLALVALSGG